MVLCSDLIRLKSGAVKRKKIVGQSGESLVNSSTAEQKIAAQIRKFKESQRKFKT